MKEWKMPNRQHKKLAQTNETQKKDNDKTTTINKTI